MIIKKNVGSQGVLGAWRAGLMLGREETWATHALLAGLCGPKEGQQFVGLSLLGDLFQSSDTVCMHAK